jgi:N12 class adenine-specific DNA methylase
VSQNPGYLEQLLMDERFGAPPAALPMPTASDPAAAAVAPDYTSSLFLNDERFLPAPVAPVQSPAQDPNRPGAEVQGPMAGGPVGSGGQSPPLPQPGMAPSAIRSHISQAVAQNQIVPETDPRIATLEEPQGPGTIADLLTRATSMPQPGVERPEIVVGGPQKEESTLGRMMREGIESASGAFKTELGPVQDPAFRHFVIEGNSDEVNEAASKLDPEEVEAFRRIIAMQGGSVDDLDDEQAARAAIWHERFPHGTMAPGREMEEGIGRKAAMAPLRLASGAVEGGIRTPAVAMHYAIGTFADLVGNKKVADEHYGAAKSLRLEGRTGKFSREGQPGKGVAAWTGRFAGMLMPSAVSLAVAGGASGPVLAYMAIQGFGGGVESYRSRLEDRGVQPVFIDQLTSGVGHGFLEVASEKLGLDLIGKVAPGIIRNIGDAALSGNKAALAEMLGRIAIASGIEGTEEAIAQVTQNFVDMAYTEAQRFDPERSVMDGVGEAFLTGALGGAVLTGPAMYHAGRFMIHNMPEMRDMDALESQLVGMGAERSEARQVVEELMGEPDMQAYINYTMKRDERGATIEELPEETSDAVQVATETVPEKLQTERAEAPEVSLPPIAATDPVGDQQEVAKPIGREEPEGPTKRQEDDVRSPESTETQPEATETATEPGDEVATTEPEPSEVSGPEFQSEAEGPRTVQGTTPEPGQARTPQSMAELEVGDEIVLPKGTDTDTWVVGAEDQPQDTKAETFTEDIAGVVVDIERIDDDGDIVTVQLDNGRQALLVGDINNEGFFRPADVEGQATFGFEGQEITAEDEAHLFGKGPSASELTDEQLASIDRAKDAGKTLDQWDRFADKHIRAMSKAEPGTGDYRFHREMALIANDALAQGGRQRQLPEESRHGETPDQAEPTERAGDREQQRVLGSSGLAGTERAEEAGAAPEQAGRPAALPETGDEPGVAEGSRTDRGGRPRPESGTRTGVRRAGEPDTGTGTAEATEPAGPTAPASIPRTDVERTQDVPDVNDRDHRIGPEDTLAPRGDITKTRANISAIKLLQKLETDGRNPTPEEKGKLAQYVGWGGLKPVFDRIKGGRWERHLQEPSRHIDDETKNWAKKWYKHYEAVKGLLSREEWEAAAHSVLNAHYTSRTVIEHGLWGLAEHVGFTGGTVLEAGAGIGHVVGLMPDSVKGQTRATLVELDSVSARIARKLYPQATVYSTGFESAPIRNNTIDLMIGNVPFREVGPEDERYPNFSLHNYFFARGIDAVRPGGLIVAITSTSTMDNKASNAFRSWMNERADLVGAIRLPDNAFKENAGTEVTTDILVFRKHDNRPFMNRQPWVMAMPKDIGADEPFLLNEYFHQHPEMLLGELSQSGTMYRADMQTLRATPGANLAEQLNEAVQSLPADIMVFDPLLAAQQGQHEAVSQEAERGDKEYSFQVDDAGTVYQVENGRREPVEWQGTRTKVERAKAFVSLREKVKALLRAQVSEDASDANVEALREDLRTAYEQSVGKLGHINDKTYYRHLHDDPEFALVSALEFVKNDPIKITRADGSVYWRQDKVITPADILTKRTQYPRRPPESADNVNDALKISVAWLGHLDTAYVAQLLGVQEDAARVQLVDEGLAFEDPESGLAIRKAEYLSGNVRRKLAQAQSAAEHDPYYEHNVKALQEVQPEDLTIKDIQFHLGSQWIDPAVIEDWVSDLLQIDRAVSVSYVEATHSYVMRPRQQAKWSTANDTTYAAGGRTALEIINDSLRQKKSIVYKTVSDEDGKDKRVKDPDATIAAQAKQEELSDLFVGWVRASDHVTAVEDAYNERFNAHVGRVWDVPEVDHYPGSNELISLYDHQKRAVGRGIEGSYLNGHEVGVGKTFALVTTAMEWRRLGLSKKPMLVTLNANTQQIVEAFKQLYPGANLLSPTKKDFEKSNRRRLFARMAAGDYDAIIVPFSQFVHIPDSKERIAAFMEAQIDELVDAREAASAAMGKKDPSVRDIQRAIDSLQKRLEKALDRKTDDVLDFEQLGVDGLLVDEAHFFKKVPFVTNMDNIKGLDKGGSERAMTLYLKAEYIRSITGGRNVVLATGTPITNTLAEAWNMIRLTRPDILREFGVEAFDDFISTFAVSSMKLEADSASRFRPTLRLREFTNVPELQQMFFAVADIVTAEDANLDLPSLLGGEPQMIALEATSGLQEYMQYLISRYEAWEKLPPRERREKSSEPLVITTLARQAGIDLRLVDEEAADEPGSKLNRAVAEIFSRWESGKGDKTTQVVFVELYRNTKTGFNIFDDMKRKLIAKGVPADQIGSILEVKTDAARENLFRRVNNGDVRVLFGTTQKLGVGVNIQERLAALHHLDAPWTPADMEQREGRILRQGNLNDTIEILQYGVVRSFDSGAYERLARKDAMIRQVTKGQFSGRTIEDLGEEDVPTYEEAAAAVSGNPMVKERVELDTEVRRLEALEGQHAISESKARRRVQQLRESAAANRQLVKELGGLVKRLGDLTEPVVTINGKTHRGEDAIPALQAYLDQVSEAAIKEVSRKRQARTVSAGTVSIGVHGVDFHLTPMIPMDRNTGRPIPDENFFRTRLMLAPGQSGGEVTGEGKTAKGILTAARSHLKKISDKMAIRRKEGEEADRQATEAEKAIGTSFPQAEELEQKRARLTEVLAALEAETRTETEETDDDVSAFAAPEPLEADLFRGIFPEGEASTGEPLPSHIQPREHLAPDIMEAARMLSAPVRYKKLRGKMFAVHRIRTRGQSIETRDVRLVRVLAHELGHAVMFRLLGRRPSSARTTFDLSITEKQARDQLKRASEYIRPLDAHSWGDGSSYVRYRSHVDELLADLFSLYLIDPGAAYRLAPEVTEALSLSVANNADVASAVQMVLDPEQVPDYRVPKGEQLTPITPDAFLDPDSDPVLRDEVFDLVRATSRELEAQMHRVQATGRRWRQQLTVKQREDIAAFVEGIGNVNIKGDTAADVQKRMTPAMHQIARQYRHQQELNRQLANQLYEDAGQGSEAIRFIENYIGHFYRKRGRKGTSLRQFATRWSKFTPHRGQRSLPTLADAVAVGLEPISTDIAWLYEKTAENNFRAAITTRFVKQLTGMTTSAGEPIIAGRFVEGWVPIHHPVLRRVYAKQIKGKTVLGEGDAWVHPSVERPVKVLLDRPMQGWLPKTIAAINSAGKSLNVSFSFFHEFALYESAQAALARFLNPIRGVLIGPFESKRLGMGFRPHLTYKAGLKLNQADIIGMEDAARHGLGMTRKSAEDYARPFLEKSLREMERWLPKYVNVVTPLRALIEGYNVHLWDNVYLGLKLFTYHTIVAESLGMVRRGESEVYTKIPKGMSIQQVKEDIASYVNDAFGGQEFLEMPVLKKGERALARPVTRRQRELLYAVMFAPDWTFSNIRIAGRTITQIKNPVMRKAYLTYWRNMIASYSAMVTLSQMAIKAIFAPDDDEMEMFPWDNEPGNVWQIDVTPIKRRVQQALGQEPQKHRSYVHPGKQFHEVIRYFDDYPNGLIASMGSKSSVALRIFIEQASAHQAGSGFPMPWAEQPFKDGMEGWEQIMARGKAVGENFLPFAFSPTNFAFTLPMRKGMTPYKSIQHYRDLLKAYADQSWWEQYRGVDENQQYKAVLEAARHVDQALIDNGYNESRRKELFNAARSKVRGIYYDKLQEAIESEDGDGAEAAARALLNLGADAGTVSQSFKSRVRRGTAEPETLDEAVLRLRLEGLLRKRELSFETVANR